MRQLPGPRQVVVEASGFWPAFERAVRPEAERLAETDARARWLQTVPGIGAYSAMVILAEVGEIARFENKRALASYAGLTPSVRESAGKRKRGGIGHHGSGTLRWIMLQVAQVAARHSPAARAWIALAAQ